ncbi:hypothetical protein GP486_001715 [Trichoglossum hirsutum]|uniref:WKF domain-containing protein n=1 Tax=Trichoglossum hirsutum TaxID=265104 RepID=A0A9P8LGB9_9PEZI|nr:hypothetical protein GP486_001715 [Trichoglossum hirsutum]
MLSQSLANSHTVHYIPAWRRIGLKLKSEENEIAAHADGTTHAEKNGKRAKRTVGEAVFGDSRSIQPSKRFKRSASATVLENPRTSSVISTNSPLSTTQPRKRKSVAFAPETKVEDGDSIKQLFKAWVAAQTDEDSAIQAEEIVKDFTSGVPYGEPGKRSKKGMQKFGELGRGAGGRAAGQLPYPALATNNTHLHSAIAYLLDHHQSKGNWKFNKAKQSYLLKHLFDFDKIPVVYNDALKGYIAGLQGQGARIRVREAAEKVKTEEAKSAKVEGSTADMSGEAKRAEWLLLALGVVGRDDVSTTRSNGIAPGSGGRVRHKLDNASAKSPGRRRKKRTLSRGDSDSSSSSGTESMDSDPSGDSSSESSSSSGSSNSDSSGSSDSSGTSGSSSTSSSADSESDCSDSNSSSGSGGNDNGDPDSTSDS